MKTLKKTLCLVLALALCLSLGTLAFAANAKEFKDVADVDSKYYQAVETLVALGVINGTGDNMLSPKATYTREEAAKIAVYLAVGVEAGDQIGKTLPTQDPFKDVSKDRWSAPYIAYCASHGILNGVGNGNFEPTGKLTGYAWAKMLCCILGYGQKDEFIGVDWAINVAKVAINRGVFTGDLAGASNNSITRQQAILFAFNTMWINRVALNGNTNQYIGDDYQGEGGGAYHNGTVNGVVVDANGYYGHIATHVFGVRKWDGAVVLANQEASLLSDEDIYNPTTKVNKWAGKTIFGDCVCEGENVVLTWTSGLDDLGESRNLVVGIKNGIVYSCVDSGKNGIVVKENGAKVGNLTAAHEFLNYMSGDNTGVIDAVITPDGNVKMGDYIKFIDNNGDGRYDFALAKDYELVKMGGMQMVGFTSDNVPHYEKANAVKATALQRNYAKGTLKISDGKEYMWSEIRNNSGLRGEFATITEKIEYTFYFDAYGNIRAYEYPEIKASDYILVTELYNKTTSNNGTNNSMGLVQDKTILTTGEIAEVVDVNGKAAEYPVTFSARYVHWAAGAAQTFFSDGFTRAWFGSEADSTVKTPDFVNHLRGIGENQNLTIRSWTNLAAYSMNDGKLTLDMAWEWHTDQMSTNFDFEDQYVGIVDLVRYNDIVAGQKHFTYWDNGYDFSDFFVDQNQGYINIEKDTKVYYVIDDDDRHEGIDKVYVKEGYGSIPNIDQDDIHYVYALCTDTKTDLLKDDYYRANILVIELTADPFVKVDYASKVIFNLSNVTKQSTGDATLNYIDTDGTEKTFNAPWDRLFFHGDQLTTIDPLTWYLMITTTTTYPDGKVETKVDLWPISENEYDEYGLGFGVVTRYDGLSSYIDVIETDGVETIPLPADGGYKVLKITRTEKMIDGQPFVTYNIAESKIENGTLYMYLRDMDTLGNPLHYLITIVAETDEPSPTP